MLSANTEHRSEFWTSTPHSLFGGRVAVRPTVAVDPLEKLATYVQTRLDQAIQAIDDLSASLEQSVTSVLVTSQPEDVVALLRKLFEKTAHAWAVLHHIKTQEHVASGLDEPDLIAYAKNTHNFYPKSAGREYFRAAVYLHADATALEKSGTFPELQPDHKFVMWHAMLVTACFIASESLKISDESTETVARAMWSHWVQLITSTGEICAQVTERLIEDAYLKAVADESEYEDDEDDVIWNPQKVARGGCA